MGGVEVILVDDGTKDNCGKIIDKYKNEHRCLIKVIHKKNGGISSARNAGLDVASGEYIIFPDPDDYMTSDFTQTILKAIEEYNFPDLVCFDYYTGYKETSMKLVTSDVFEEGLVAKELFLQEAFQDKYLKSYVWQKAIKKEFYKGRNFDESVHLAEDYKLLTEMLVDMSTFVYLKKSLYCYMLRSDSLTKISKVEEQLEFVTFIERRYRLFQSISKGISSRIMFYAAYTYLRLCYENNMENEKADYYYSFIKENYSILMQDKEITLNDKKHCILINLGLLKYYIQLRGLLRLKR